MLIIRLFDCDPASYINDQCGQFVDRSDALDVERTYSVLDFGSEWKQPSEPVMDELQGLAAGPCRCGIVWKMCRQPLEHEKVDSKLFAPLAVLF